MKISASIIVRNEESNIAELCDSLSWADEIVFVDSDSEDRTVELARKYTDKVYNREFKGFKDKHTFADSKTTGDWIFWIDADERVTPELKKAIESLRERDPATLPDGFRIARRTEFLGRWIKHSGWYPDYQMRLYRKSASYWDGIAPHQTARVDGNIETLDGEFEHFTKQSLSEYHRTVDFYSTLAAEHHFELGKKISRLDMLIGAITGFIRSYIFKAGFRDGTPGLIIALFTGYGVFLRYAKIWEKRNSEPK